jgi:hypothetical protein
MIPAWDNCQLQQMSKTTSVCATLCKSDQQKTIQEISEDAGISAGRVHNIPHINLNMHYICQHFVPKMLTPGNKETRMTLAGDLITMGEQAVDIFF